MRCTLAQAGHRSETYTVSLGTSSANQTCTFGPVAEDRWAPRGPRVYIMAPASLVPSLDADIHLVLCRFGRAGLAYVETDPAEADATTVVQNLLHGRYAQPLRVIALNVDEGWSQDVSEAMAHKVREIAEHEDYELTQGTLDFIEAHMGRVMQPTLPLW